MDEAGAVRTELALDDQPSGLGWLPDGRMLVVAMRRRRVLRIDRGGDRKDPHADLSMLLATFHANDMVVDDQGRAYVAISASTSIRRYTHAASRVCAGGSPDCAAGPDRSERQRARCRA